MMYIEYTFLNQPGIHGRVKPGDVNRVVDVAIRIVIEPAGLDSAKYPVSIPALRAGRFRQLLGHLDLRFVIAMRHLLVILPAAA
jgi:hypothetical protein